MKLRLAAGAVIAAAALAVPAVAHAVTYAPFSATDPTGDVYVSSQQMRGTINLYSEIDMTSVRGARSAVQHSIAVKYVNLEKTPYTRYAIVLQQPNSDKTRLLEVRVGGGGAVNTAFYTASQNGESLSIKQTYCTGARIIPDFAKDKITAVFPQDCFTNTFPQGVYVYALAGEWSSSSWTNGPLTGQNNGNDADASDNFSGIWDYSEGSIDKMSGARKGTFPKLY